MGRINQLPASATLNSTDVIAVDAGTGGTTNKMTATNLAGQLKALGNYQDKLTFDSAPTAGSNNPVTSGGIKTALDGKQNTLTFDSAPTAGSNNPVTSGGIATAIAQSTANSEYGDIQITSATSGASLYGSNFYIRFNKVVSIYFGFKLENATVGKAYTISTNIPATCAPPYSARLSAVATNGDTTGSVNVSYAQATGFSVYADKAGTTYAIGTLIYIIS